MTGWEVERTTRTACRSGSIPAGGSSPMPSPNQWAERRAERRARHTGSRWALRALVIGGLTGAAWLLPGTVAHAADHDVEPVGSLSGSTMDVAPVPSGEPRVRDLRKAAAQPLESGPPTHRHHVAKSVLPAPERALPELSEPVAVPDGAGLGEATGDGGSTIDTEPTGTTPRTSIVPPRASGAEQDERTWSEPVDTAAEPMTALVSAHGSSRAHRELGAAGGIPAGPGASLELGSVAVLPARHAPGLVDGHRFPLASGIAARHRDAEAPTVSPD